MCRFIAYLGKPILINDLLYKPKNSLIMQSQSARESQQMVNGDGFGLGWYNPEVGKTPGVFHSTQPAWNDLNLVSITSVIKSPCFFGHVRAAITGDVAKSNCHPFYHEELMFMHNGAIHEFEKIKRRIRSNLSNEAYAEIIGHTDTEHMFAMFLDHLKNAPQKDPAQAYMHSLQKVISIINDLQQTYNNNEDSYLNLVVSDGERIVACRYVSNESLTARTMHYSVGSDYQFKDGHCHIVPVNGKPAEVAVVASEKLTDSHADWQTVPQNHFLVVNKDLSVVIEPVQTV